MVSEQQSTSSRPWMLVLVLFMVVLLIAAHVFALVYWIYRLATEKQQSQSQSQPQRRKAH